MRVRRTHLELAHPDRLRPAPLAPLAAPGISLAREHPCAVDMYRTLYRIVGERWHWRDRLAWDDARLAAHLKREAVHVWVLREHGSAAGWFELAAEDDGDVELVYFGLVPAAIGRGLGGALLTRAAEEAWRLGARRVRLNTCTLDAPQAMPNYLARGFTPYAEDAYEVADGAVSGG